MTETINDLNPFNFKYKRDYFNIETVSFLLIGLRNFNNSSDTNVKSWQYFLHHLPLCDGYLPV